MTRKTILRRAPGDGDTFTTLRNTMLQDRALSNEARGLLCALMSYPTDWDITIPWITRTFDIGRDRAYRLINELIAAGYCARAQGRGGAGTWGACTILFSDDPGKVAAQQPLPENPDAAEPDAAQPHTAEPQQTNRDSVQTTIDSEGAREGGTDGAGHTPGGERLPFSLRVIRELTGLDVDVRALVERYMKKTAGRHIDDPSAYLLTMGRDEAAKRLGISVQTLNQLGSRNPCERKAAAARSAGITGPSTEAVARARRQRPQLVGPALELIAGRAFATIEAADRAFEAALTNARFAMRPGAAIAAQRGCV